jgi:hypothetical protein
MCFNKLLLNHVTITVFVINYKFLLANDFVAAKTGAAVKTKTASNNSNTIFFIFDSFVLLLKFAG